MTLGNSLKEKNIKLSEEKKFYADIERKNFLDRLRSYVEFYIENSRAETDTICIHTYSVLPQITFGNVDFTMLVREFCKQEDLIFEGTCLVDQKVHYKLKLKKE